MSLPVQVMRHEDGPYCGAKKKAARGGGPCRQTAGAGTNHPGVGRCKWHGGNAPILHGRYSKIQRPRIRELIEAYEADPDPLNLLPDLAAARAHYHDWVERYDEWREVILAWWQSWALGRRAWSAEELQAFRELVNDMEDHLRTSGTNGLTERQESTLALARSFIDALASGTDGRPRQMLDISAGVTILNDISKIVERVERIRASNVVTRIELLRVMGEMGRVVRQHVSDPGVAQRITEGWNAILVA